MLQHRLLAMASVQTLLWDHFGVSVKKTGTIWGSGSFHGQFEDQFGVGEHFGVRIISGSSTGCPNPVSSPLCGDSVA